MSKPGPKATSIAQPKPVIQSVKPAPEKNPDIQVDDLKVSESKPVQSNRSSNIMNTTLDLLDNSDMDLPVDPEIRMESVRIILIVIAYSHVYIEICHCFLFFFTIYSWFLTCVINWRQWKRHRHVQTVSVILYAEK